MIEEFQYSTHTIHKIFGSNSFDFNSNIKYISTSSREIKKDTLFIPLVAARDGHEFIEDAFKNGATLFLAEKNNPHLKNLPKDILNKIIFVDNTLLALGKLAKYHRSRFNPITIGITGSSGKTTTKELISIIALEYGNKNIVYTEKNYNNEIGVPFTIFKLNIHTKILICEMGMNHSKEISRLATIVSPDYSIITNIGPCHIENLGSIKNIAKAKAEIIEGMKSGSKVFVPKNILHREIFIDKSKEYSVQLKFFDLKTDKIISIQKMNQDGFKLNIFGIEIDWKLPGIKILENICGVLSVCNSIGIDREKIISGLKKFKAKDKRFVIEKKYFQIINDTYNANPDSMKSSILATEQFSNSKNFYLVLGDMKELGKFSKKYHSELGKFISNTSASGVISFGVDSKIITDNIPKKDFLIHFQKNEIDNLVEFIKQNIPKNSLILFKGSRSMKMEEIVERLKNAK